MRIALELLDPVWLPGKQDWGCGLRCLCPAHDEPAERHAIELFFENCCGGYGVIAPDTRRYHRTGTSFATLSLHPVIEVPGCFRGWLRDGVFFVLDH